MTKRLERMIRRWSVLMMLMLTAMGAQADDKTTDEAKQMFLKVYNSVFGTQGSSLTYSVNIIGIYKTQGDIIYKGKKSKFKSSKHEGLCDGVSYYKVDHKKKTVNIYRADDEEADKMMSKFKFNADDYTYSYSAESNYYIITAHNKHSSLKNVKELQLKVTKSGLTPISAKIKVAFLSTTVKISNFKSGNIADDVFTFAKSNFTGYKTFDHRTE